MSLQYDGLRCPRLEIALKRGAKLGISRSGDTSLLSRLENKNDLIASELSDSLSVLLKKTDWQLNPDKLVFTMPIFRECVKRSALEQLVEKGYYLVFFFFYDVLKGYIIDPNKNIIITKKTIADLSRLLQLMELEAIQHL